MLLHAYKYIIIRPFTMNLDRAKSYCLPMCRSRIVAEPLAQFGLVVDGLSLALALKFGPELLREVSSACSTVLACRLSPLQKCEVTSPVPSLGVLIYSLHGILSDLPRSQ